MHHSHEGHHKNHASCGSHYPSPKEAMEKAEREKVLYTTTLYVGTDVGEPDYLVTVSVDLESSTYSQVVHRITIPNVGDGLHHLGWNACNSCRDDESKSRRLLTVPGQRSSRIHIIDTADERAPKVNCHPEQEGVDQRRLLRGLWGGACWSGSGERHTLPRERRHLGNLDLRPTTHSKQNR